MSAKAVKSGPSRIRAIRAGGAVDVAVCVAAVFAVLIALGGTMRTQGAARAAGVGTGLITGFAPEAATDTGHENAASRGVREN